MMRSGAIAACAALAAVLALGSVGPTALENPQSAGALTPQTPRLLVLIVVDQFRADYADWYGSQWTAGLHRLFSRGAVFPRSATPWAITKTCSGHASIGTGTLPSTHGLVGNEWFDRQQRAFVACTEDPTARAIGFAGRLAGEHHSGRWLNAPTLADELRRQATVAPRIVSVALKARAAIGLGGQGGDSTIILWEEDSGTWATSTAFASAAWPAVESYFTRRPPSAGRADVWQRLLPAARYQFEDQAAGEPGGGQFPHALVTSLGGYSPALWDASPWSDAFVGDLATTVATEVGLGQRPATDLLAIGFSALDYVGHTYGPRSHEVQDLLVRLDRTIGDLLDRLDRTVGAGNYVVGFTSDHGVALLPEQSLSVAGTPGGRLNPGAVATAVDLALRARLGQRRYIDAVTTADIHFSPGVLTTIAATPGLTEAVTVAAQGVPGVDRVYWSADLERDSGARNAAVDAMRASYYRGRSGDLTFLPAHQWVVSAAGTNHGGAHSYDREVPVVFYGAGVTAGRYMGATPMDVAPTLAAVAGFTMPRATGMPRREVVAVR